MLERFLRSPFMMMMMLIFIGIVFTGAKEGWPFQFIFIPYFVFFFLYFSLVVYHNKSKPGRKMRIFSITPYELREDDEGMQYLTFKAMRNVYIFYYFAIPIGSMCIFLFNDVFPYFSMWLLISFGVIQYFIYWLGIRKVLQEEEEV